MRREYTDIVFFYKCLYSNYDVDGNDFVSFFSDALLVTRLILDFLWYHPCVVQTALNVAFFNRIVPLWNSLPSNVCDITNYSFLYPI